MCGIVNSERFRSAFRFLTDRDSEPSRRIDAIHLPRRWHQDRSVFIRTGLGVDPRGRLWPDWFGGIADADGYVPFQDSDPV